MTFRQAIDQASVQISRRDAETLLLHLTGRDRAWLLSYGQDPLPPQLATPFFALVARRAAHEPLQYLTGRQEFFGLDFHVTPSVLIPRPETELLVEAVLDFLRATPGASPPRLADVGTGSGAIALALAAHLPGAEILALDLSPAALEVARGNANRLGLAGSVRFAVSDLLDAAPGAESLDVVVSNPPYVPQRDAPAMQPEVVHFEPHLALFAGDDGLSVYRRLVPEARDRLRTGGLLALEIGYGQQGALLQLLESWNRVRFLDDYAGIPRVALAERP